MDNNYSIRRAITEFEKSKTNTRNFYSLYTFFFNIHN